MLLHTVLFWLRSDLTPAQIQAFEFGIKSLTKISTVRWGFTGIPADKRQTDTDSSYTWKLVVAFDDMAGHAVYEVDQLHLAFLDQCKTYWSKVLIYDAEAV